MTFVPSPLAYGGNNTSGPIEVATACNAHGGPSGRMDFESETFIAHTLRGDGFDASEDGTGRGTPLVPVGFHARQDPIHLDDVSLPLEAKGWQAIAFNLRGREGGAMPEVSDVASVRSASGGSSRSYVAGVAVRRLTPRECERLQGFEDDYTLVPYRGKPAADGPRYRAIGNSIAIPVLRWIGDRIEKTESIDHCESELSSAEQRLRDGAPNEDSLALWLGDWTAEKRIIEGRHEK